MGTVLLPRSLLGPSPGYFYIGDGPKPFSMIRTVPNLIMATLGVGMQYNYNKVTIGGKL